MFPSIHLFFHFIFGVCFSSNRAYCVIWGHEEANRYPKLNWSQLFLVWYFPLPFPFLVFFVFVNLFSTWNIWLEKFGFCYLCRESDVRKRPKETNKQIRTSKFWAVFEKSLLQYVNPLFSNFASFFFLSRIFFKTYFATSLSLIFFPFWKSWNWYSALNGTDTAKVQISWFLIYELVISDHLWRLVIIRQIPTILYFLYTFVGHIGSSFGIGFYLQDNYIYLRSIYSDICDNFLHSFLALCLSISCISLK